MKIKITATEQELIDYCIEEGEAARLSGATVDATKSNTGYVVSSTSAYTNPSVTWHIRNDMAVIVPTLDLTKPVQTRDGRKVEIKFVDETLESYPIVGVVTESDGRRYSETWTIEGKGWLSAKDDHEGDLVQVPEPLKECWVNIYKGASQSEETYSCKPTRAKADKDAAVNRIACIKIQYREGEGL